MDDVVLLLGVVVPGDVLVEGLVGGD